MGSSEFRNSPGWMSTGSRDSYALGSREKGSYRLWGSKEKGPLASGSMQGFRLLGFGLEGGGLHCLLQDGGIQQAVPPVVEPGDGLPELFVVHLPI